MEFCFLQIVYAAIISTLIKKLWGYEGGIQLNLLDEAIKVAIINGNTALGIEFGSTRIKAVLVDKKNTPIAAGSHEWENQLENNIWTYSLEDIWQGLQSCYQDLARKLRT